mmetsp:Transcript_36206/g.61054  ORF Transcript_36206/g.61054 Transcript_36206/m.61054 type:complete len:272 (-) Transcript_36206:124-939(-)
MSQPSFKPIARVWMRLDLSMFFMVLLCHTFGDSNTSTWTFSKLASTSLSIFTLLACVRSIRLHVMLGSLSRGCSHSASAWLFKSHAAFLSAMSDSSSDWHISSCTSTSVTSFRFFSCCTMESFRRVSWASSCLWGSSATSSLGPRWLRIPVRSWFRSRYFTFSLSSVSSFSLQSAKSLQTGCAAEAVELSLSISSSSVLFFFRRASLTWICIEYCERRTSSLYFQYAARCSDSAFRWRAARLRTATDFSRHTLGRDMSNRAEGDEGPFPLG